MKDFEKVLPYLLLIGYLALSQANPLNLANSIVLVALAGLSGYRAYLNNKEQPNYAMQFAEELASQQKKINDLQGIIGQQAISQQKQKQAEQIRW